MCEGEDLSWAIKDDPSVEISFYAATLNYSEHKKCDGMKRCLLHVPVVAKTLRGKDRFPSTSPWNVIPYCVEGVRPSISASLTFPGSTVTGGWAAPDGALSSTRKLSYTSSGADQARLTLVEVTLTVRSPGSSMPELSGSVPELRPPKSGGASVFRGRGRSGISFSWAGGEVVCASLTFSASASGDVGLGATVNKSRLKSEFLTGSAGVCERSCEEKSGLKRRTQIYCAQSLILGLPEDSTFFLSPGQLNHQAKARALMALGVSAINLLKALSSPPQWKYTVVFKWMMKPCTAIWFLPI